MKIIIKKLIIVALLVMSTLSAQAGIGTVIKTHRVGFGGACAAGVVAGMSYAARLRTLDNYLTEVRAQINKSKKIESVTMRTLALMPDKQAFKECVEKYNKKSLRPRSSRKGALEDCLTKIEKKITRRMRLAAACTGLFTLIGALGLYLTR